jgi:hypothetical protein
MTEEASFPPYRRSGDGLGPVFILCFFPGAAENTSFANVMAETKRLMISSEIGFPFNCHFNIIMVDAPPNVSTLHLRMMTLTYRSMITCGLMINAAQLLSSSEG